jgi:hypothetical protein
MYRHDLRFVLRFGLQAEFAELVRRLHEEETARGWTPPRVWHAVSGHVNGVVFEHDYADEDTYRRERAELHEKPGSVGEVLAQLTQLAVPATAVQSELVAVTFPPAG